MSQRDSSFAACSFAVCNSALQAANAVTGAAQVHGYLCGSVCAGVRPGAAHWLTMLREFTDQPLHDTATQQILLAMLADTLEGLESEDFDFILLLPDDDQPLSERAVALGLWCEGFLVGFGSATLELSEPAQEVLRDMVEISRIAPPEEDEADDEAENGLQEVVEYVRVATIDLYETSRMLRSSQPH